MNLKAMIKRFVKLLSGYPMVALCTLNFVLVFVVSTGNTSSAAFGWACACVGWLEIERMIRRKNDDQ